MSSDDPSILIVDRLPLINDFRAFVHPSKLGELKLKNGTIVEIKSESGKIVCAPVYAVSELCQYGRVQLGRALRINLRCYLGEKVQLKRAKDVDIAECVVLAPIDNTIENISGTYADILFNSPINFQNLPLRKNQVIPVFALNRVIEFKVVITQPTAAVIVDNIDVIACRNTTVSRGNSPKFDEICYDDIGGLNSVINRIRQIIELPLLQPKMFRLLNKMTAKDLMIIANSGCGKTLISKAIQNETFANFLRIDCYSLLTKTVEEAIAFLLKSVDEAVSNQPSIVYFDDFDIVAIPEINEDSNPDSRISNALCSALKRMRAEKSVIVIASARDDSKIRKDIKAKFDRKINIMFPIGEEKNSIVRIIAHRYTVKYNLPIEDLTASLTGKSSAQLTQSCHKLLLKPIAILAKSISSKKTKTRDNDKNDENEGDGDTKNNNNSHNIILSIDQLKRIVINQYNLSNDADNLFEDTSFDDPIKYKPINNIIMNKGNQLNDDTINDGEIRPLYDPEFEGYNQRCQPIRNKIPAEIEFIDHFEGEPLYNEGMSTDENKKRYTYDDLDSYDYYSDDDENDRNRNKNGGKWKKNMRKGGSNGKSTKFSKNRKYKNDYYSDEDDDYYDYYSDEDDDDDKRRNEKRGKQKTPLKNNKKGKNKNNKNDDYYDYYSDDDDGNENDNRNKKNSKNKKADNLNVSKNEKTSSATKRDPFAEKDGNSISFPTAKKGKTTTTATATNNRPVSGGFPAAKTQKTFVNPFDNNKNSPTSIISKKNQQNTLSDEKPEKLENDNKKAIGKKSNSKRHLESDDDEIQPKKKSSSKKLASEAENEQEEIASKKKEIKNPFGKPRSIRVDDESDDSDDNKIRQKTSKNATKKENPFRKQSAQLSSSDNDDSQNESENKNKKPSNRIKSQKDDDEDKKQTRQKLNRKPQQAENAPKKKTGLRNKPFGDDDSDSDNNTLRNDPFAKKGNKEDSDEEDNQEEKIVKKRQNKNSKPEKRRRDSENDENDDDDDNDEPPRKQTKSKQMARKKRNNDNDDEDDDDDTLNGKNAKNRKNKNPFGAKKQNRRDENNSDSEEEEKNQSQRRKNEDNNRKKKTIPRDISDDDEEESSDVKPPPKPTNRKRGNPFG